MLLLTMRFLSFFKKNNAPNILSNSLIELEENIEKYGYTIINLLSEDVDDLYANESYAIYEQTNKMEDFNGFLSIGRINNSALRNESKAINIKYLFNAVNAFFENKYDIITGMHLFKKSGKNGILNPHQDSSLTDENKYNSYFLWYPINGSDSEDGTIEIIPFSHKLQIPQRSLNIHWTLMDYEKKLWKLMQKVILKKGQAVVIHSRTIHGSGINKNRAIRMASNIFLKPKEAPFLHYYAAQPNDENIEVFEVDEAFYSDKNILEKPVGYKLYKMEKNKNEIFHSFKEIENNLKQSTVNKSGFDAANIYK